MAGHAVAYLRVSRSEYYLGIFDDPAYAARVYDEAALRLHGAFARTNKMLGLLP